MKKSHFYLKLDPLGIETVLELILGGVIAVVLMRWLGM